MKFWIPVAIFFALLATSLSAAEPGQNESGKAWLKAMLAHDLDAVVAVYAPDAEYFPPDNMKLQGTEAIRADFAGFLNNFNVQSVEILEAEHETHGDLSAEWGLYRMTFAPKAGGQAITVQGRFTDVSKKINGKWLVISDHASMPLPPAPSDKK